MAGVAALVMGVGAVASGRAAGAGVGDDAAAPVSVRDVAVELRPGHKPETKSKTWLRLELTAKVTGRYEKGDTVRAVGACRVGAETLVADTSIHGRLHELDKGTSKRLDTSLFIVHPLDATPTSCEIKFTFHRGHRDDTGTLVGTFCFASGKTSAGRCR